MNWGNLIIIWIGILFSIFIGYQLAKYRLSIPLQEAIERYDVMIDKYQSLCDRYERLTNDFNQIMKQYSKEKD